MKIGGIQKSSTIDFPGQLSCVLFTVGCNLDCFYCHNRALLSGNAPLLSEEELFSFLKKRIGLLDGVVVSGGEPTLQSDLYDFILRLKEMGYKVKLDTNGQLSSPIERLLSDNLIDYLAIDLKASRDQYEIVTGCDGFDKALSLLLSAVSQGVQCEGRTTVYPGLRAEGLLELAKALPQLPRWRLNVYHMPSQFREEDKLRLRIPALSEPELIRLLPELKEYQPEVIM